MKLSLPFLFLLTFASAACSGSDRPPAPAAGGTADTTQSAAPVQAPESEGVNAAAPSMPTASDPPAARVDLPTVAAAATDPVGAVEDGGEPVMPPLTPADQPDSAAQILERAAARYQELNSMQADFSMSYENPLLRSHTSGRGVLYQKKPDRLLLRFSEPAGDVILSDGTYYWIYYPSVDRDQVLRSVADVGASGGVDLQAQFLGDPVRRFQYNLDGEERVGDRPAWAFTLIPRQSLGYRQLRVWIDRRDYLAHRFEITEDNGSVRRFELSSMRLDPKLGDELFRFDVPAGAHVITR